MELAFYLSGLVAVLVTLRVITHTQPVYALLYLIISLLATSCVCFSLGAHFAGALEIIIYTGAIMVLFVFVVMVLNISVNIDKGKRVWIHSRTWIGPSLISLMLLVVLVLALVGSENQGIAGDLIPAKTVGIALFGPYVLAVELASMLLLAGLVVAFHLGRNERNNANMLYKRSQITEIFKRRGEE